MTVDDVWGLGESSLLPFEDEIEDLLRKDDEE